MTYSNSSLLCSKKFGQEQNPGVADEMCHFVFRAISVHQLPSARSPAEGWLLLACGAAVSAETLPGASGSGAFAEHCQAWSFKGRLYRAFCNPRISTRISWSYKNVRATAAVS